MSEKQSINDSTVIAVDEAFIKRMEVYRKAREGTRFIEGCSENVVVFSERMLGIKPYAWQVNLLQQMMTSAQDKKLKKEFVALTSRQIGKSTLVAIFSLWCTVFNKYPGGTGNNTTVLITSASDTQAKKLLSGMRNLMRSGDRHMGLTYRDEQDLPIFGKEFFSDLLSDNDPNNTTTISFKDYNPDIHGYLLKDSKVGSTIKSYPPTSSVLGETASIVVIDEAGMTDKISDEFFYDYIYPVGNTTSAIRLYTSTPWESSGFFFNMVDPDNKKDESIRPSVVTYTIEAIKLEDPEMYDNIMKTSVAQLLSDGKHDAVQRGYYCRFVKSEKSYFDPEKVEGAFVEDIDMVDSYTGECDMGVDFGGETTSKTVITISRLDDEGVIRRLYHKSYPVGEDRSLIADIAELLKIFNVQRIIPDDCPAGWYRIKEMRLKNWNIQPMNFKADKVKKYGSFRGKLHKGFVESYKDSDLKYEMLGMQFSEGARTTLIKHAPGYNDDLIDSFIMSAYFFLSEDSKITFGTFD